MRFISAICALALTASSAAACGGSFSGFVSGLKKEAISKGHSRATVDAFFAGTKQDGAVIKADRAQGVFQKNFIDFSRALIRSDRINGGAANYKKYRSTFNRMQRDYGVNPGVLLAFWAFETDFGAVQGNFNTRNALLTLAHDCRRPELFRPQVFAAIELFEQGGFDPARTTGAWAGEIGMVQMLPEDIISNGVDGDGDGKVDLKRSAPDALLSGARMLRSLGWQAGQPWLQEVTMPANFDWSKTGLDKSARTADWASMGVKPRSGGWAMNAGGTSILLPMGHKGPAFIAYPNFRVYFEWNKSFTYVLTAAYFATRLEGAPVYNAGNPDKGLSGNQMKQLQTRLQRRGYDVGKVDGILGARTRAAVQAEQKRLGLTADAWPTPALLSRL